VREMLAASPEPEQAVAEQAVAEQALA